MSKLQSLVVVRLRTIARACLRAPSLRRLWPWLLAGLAVSRTWRGTGLLRVHVGPGKEDAVLLDSRSQQQLDVFAEVLLNRNYPLERVPFQPRLVVDLGANIGFFSAAAKRAFPGAVIRGWEPDPFNYRIAVRHPILSSGDVKIEQAAVSDCDGTARLTGSGHGCLISETGTEGEAVSCIDFPRWWRQHGSPEAVCKIDVEGYEEKLLPAMRGLWVRPCVIFLETHALGGCDNDLIALLREEGFEVNLLRTHSLPGDPRLFSEYFAVLPAVETDSPK